MFRNIFESIKILGGTKSGESITLVTSKSNPRTVTTAIYTSNGKLVVRLQKESSVQCCILPWNDNPLKQPCALALSPTAEHLLVAVTDGSLYVIPLFGLFGSSSAYSDNVSTADGSVKALPDDVVVIPCNGSRSKPTALVWWQPTEGSIQLGIIGTELGELCIVELSGGREVGGTYIPKPVATLHVWSDNSMDSTYLLITDTSKNQFRLILEQRSADYLYPLEGSGGGGTTTTEEESTATTEGVAPRSRLLGLKQMSVEKLQSLRKSISDAKQKTGRRPQIDRPLTFSKGVDTCDNTKQDSDTTLVPSATATEQPPKEKSEDDLPVYELKKDDTKLTADMMHALKKSAKKTETEKTCEVKEELEEDPDRKTCDKGSSTLPSSSPCPITSFIPDILSYFYSPSSEDTPTMPLGSPQYIGDRYALAFLYPQTSLLRGYIPEVAPNPQFMYKLVPDVSQVIVQENLIYCTSLFNKNRLNVISANLAASVGENSEGNQNLHVVETVELPPDEVIQHIYPCPPLVSEEDNLKSSSAFEDYDGSSIQIDLLNELPMSYAKACLVVTKTALYICQTRTSKERLFLECVLQTNEVELWQRISTIFSITSKILEIAADAKLKAKKFTSALALYKTAKCSLFRCALKFAWAGLVPQFLAYSSKLLSTSDNPSQNSELSLGDRKHLSTLTVMAYLVQLCALKSTDSLRKPRSKKDSSLILDDVISSQETIQLQKSSRVDSSLGRNDSDNKSKLLDEVSEEAKRIPPAKTVLATLLLFLKSNKYYDSLLCLCLAAETWRWETLQYICSNRGLQLEKLCVLLTETDAASPESNMETTCNELNSTESENSSFDFLKSIEEDSTNMPSSFGSNTSLSGHLKNCVYINRSLNKDVQHGFLHCLSDPELRSVLLMSPKLFKSHTEKVMQLLPDLSVAILERLACLFDPSHPVIIPFLCSNYNDDNIKNCHLFIEIFLKVVVALNSSRKWRFHQNLVDFEPLSYGSEDAPLQSAVHPSIPILCCGYGSSSLIVNDGTRGKLLTWGSDESGVLGHGNFSTKTVPPCLAHHPLIKSVLQLYKVCEGDTVTGDASNESQEPRVVTSLCHVDVKQSSCGRSHMLALSGDGEVYGWGSNPYGQVGGTAGYYSRPSLVGGRILMKHVVSQVACGQYHSLAVTSSGQLFSWGWGVHGQLGHGNVEDCNRPTLVQSLKHKFVVTCGAGYAHSCCLDSEGLVYCWGCGVYGQCGSGNLNKLTTPRGVTLPSPVSHLASGYFHCVCVTKDHEVFSWGSHPAFLRVQAQMQKKAKALRLQRLKEQKRYGDSHIREGPPTPVFSYKDLEMKQDGALLQQNEELLKQDGDQEKSDDDLEKSGGVQEKSDDDLEKSGGVQEKSDDDLEKSGGVQEKADSDLEKSGGVQEKADSDLEKSGGVQQKQDGDQQKPDNDNVKQKSVEEGVEESNSGEDNSVLVCCTKDQNVHEIVLPATPTIKVQEVDSVEHVSIDEETKKFKSSGKLWRPTEQAVQNTVPSCDPDDIQHLLPKKVSLSSQWGACAQISCGSQHTALLTTHGALYLWGRNMSGQLGTGDRQDNLVPVRVLEDTKIAAVSCGSDFTTATDRSGRIFGWGSNYYSQLTKLISTESAKTHGNKFFTLKTSKRILKVPHSLHSNVESPRVIIENADCSVQRSSSQCAETNYTPLDKQWLRKLQLSKIESEAHVIFENKFLPSLNDEVSRNNNDISVKADSEDDPYGPVTLYCALFYFQRFYNKNCMLETLEKCAGYQCIAAVHKSTGDYDQSLHYNLKAASEEGMEMISETLEQLLVKDSSHLLQLVTQASKSFVDLHLPIGQLELLLANHKQTLLWPLFTMFVNNPDLLGIFSDEFCLKICAEFVSSILPTVDIESIRCDLSKKPEGDGSDVANVRSALKEGILSSNKYETQGTDFLVSFSCNHKFNSSYNEYLSSLEKSTESTVGYLGNAVRILLKGYSNGASDISEGPCPTCLFKRLLKE